MTIHVFEEKEYPSVSAIRREYFPHRSEMHVAKYIKMGCKSVKEVVAAEIQVERAGRVGARRGVKNSRFNAKLK